MKKILAIVLSIIIVFTMNTSSFAVTLNKFSLNSTKFGELSNEKIQEKFIENIKEIERYIENQGTTVLQELSKEKERLEKILITESDICNRVKLENLIQMYANMISDYNDYINNGGLDNGNIIINGAWHPILSPAVAAIVSFFIMNELILAAELLTYAKEVSTGGIYSPYFGYRVYETEEYSRLSNEIRYSGTTSGSGSSAFENEGDAIEDIDLYYAIHAYEYEYRSNGQLIITDYYDYKINEDYQGIAGTAIDTMYLAQVMGVIVPFDVLIEITW